MPSSCYENWARVALIIWTARISTKDPDAFDVTRKTGNKAFAPSWEILGPMLDLKRIGKTATSEQWKDYARGYFEEMRASRRSNPSLWRALLARSRVVLTCYCTNPARCHRTLLGRFLEKLGATFEGELDERDPGQEDLFKIAMALGED